MAETSLKPLKAILETIRERAEIRLETTSRRQRGAFNALEMQRLSICEAFHETGSVGVGWPVSEMQKY